jgi:head-tail adaptor
MNLHAVKPEVPLSAEASEISCWEMMFESSAREAALVVMADGGRWPTWLTRELSGKNTSMIAVQQPEETRSQFGKRVQSLVEACLSGVAPMQVRNIIWLRAPHESEASWALELIEALGASVAADYRLRVVSGYDSSVESLAVEAEPHSQVENLSDLGELDSWEFTA